MLILGKRSMTYRMPKIRMRVVRGEMVTLSESYSDGVASIPLSHHADVIGRTVITS